MLYADSMCANDKGRMILRGWKGGQYFIRSPFGDTTSMCRHYSEFLSASERRIFFLHCICFLGIRILYVATCRLSCDVFFSGSYAGCICLCPLVDHIVETCTFCKQLRVYDIRGQIGKVVYTKGLVYPICNGPAGYVLGVDAKSSVLQFEASTWSLVRTIPTATYNVRRVCYVKESNMLVVTCHSPGRVEALSLSNGRTRWTFQEQIDGECISPQGVSCDASERVYVADKDNRCLLMLSSFSGQLLRRFRFEGGMGNIHDLCWRSVQPFIAILHEARQTSQNEVPLYLSYYKTESGVETM